MLIKSRFKMINKNLTRFQNKIMPLASRIKNKINKHRQNLNNGKYIQQTHT